LQAGGHRFEPGHVHQVIAAKFELKPYHSAGFQINPEGEEDGSGDTAGAGRLFSSPL
jgi:hypothetical protein